MRMINPKHLNTDEKYFSDTKYMSVSRFKKLHKCELDGTEDFTGTTTALLVGSFVDAHVSGTLEKFKVDHPEIISTRGRTAGQLKVDFKKAEEICDFIDNDPRIQQFLVGDKQSVFTGNIEGVPFKAKTDIYAEGIVVSDLKIMHSITSRNGEYYDFISQWRYDIQMAVYQELIYQNTGIKLPTFIIAVTKEDVIDSAIIEIPSEILDRALDEVKENIVRYYDIWQGKIEPIGCGICKTCISKRKETPIISQWDMMGGE